jgi:hypothetical protein
LRFLVALKQFVILVYLVDEGIIEQLVLVLNDRAGELALSRLAMLVNKLGVALLENGNLLVDSQTGLAWRWLSRYDDFDILERASGFVEDLFISIFKVYEITFFVFSLRLVGFLAAIKNVFGV